MSYLIFAIMMIGTFGYAVTFLATGMPEHSVIAHAFAIVLPVSFASLLSAPRDVFSPLNILTYVMIMSSPVFALYIFYMASAEKVELAMFGLSFVELTSGINLIAFGMCCLLVGYGVMALVGQRKKNMGPDTYSISRIRLLLLLTMAASVIGGYYFAAQTGFSINFADGIISKKSVHEGTVGVAPRGSSLTHWRILGYSLPHALLLVIFALHWTGKIRLGKLDFVLAAVLFGSSVFIPFIASSRTAIIEVLIILMMLRHYALKKMPITKIAVVGLAGLILLGVLGQLRQNPNTERASGLGRYVELAEEVIGASYFMDLSKNAIVVKSVPEDVDFLYGGSLFALVLTPIPRQWWPEKPIVRVGYHVGQVIIDLRNQTGIPPGFIAELYLNLGYQLVILPMLLVGALLQRIYTAIRDPKNHTPGRLLMYVVGIEIVAISLLPTDFNYAVLQIIFYGGPIWFFLVITRRRHQPEAG